MKHMLLVFAHPDDESFAVAGTVAKYVRSGWQVDLICATRGEAGSNGTLAGDLGAIRQKELERAATILGMASVTFLGYKDGTLTKQNPSELEDPIYRKMYETRPDIVVTFDTTGISYHPDHIRVCYSATYAYQEYAKEIAEGPLRTQDRSFRESEAITKEPKLYYVCMPRSVATYLKKHKIIPVQSYGKPCQGTPDKFITTVIDIRRSGNIKTKALKAHISQSQDTERFLSFLQNPFLRQEHFILRMQGMHEVFMGKYDRIANRL